MAVARMKKVWLMAHRNDQPALVAELQEAGAIEVQAINGGEPLSKGADSKLFAARAEQLGLELTKVQFVLDFFKKSNPPKKGLIASLVKDRLVVSRSRFDSIDKKLDFEDLYNTCQEYDGALAAALRELKQARGELSDLEAWTGFDARFDDLKPSKYLAFAVGQIKPASFEALTTGLANACSESEIVFTGQGDAAQKIIIVYYSPHHVAVERALAAAGFEHVSTDGWSATPEAESLTAGERLEKLELERRRIESGIAGLLPLEADLMILRDWLRARLIRYNAQSGFGRTDATFVLQGWIEADRVEAVAKRFASAGAAVDCSFSDPEPGDRVPIVLKNLKWLRPFEVLTRLYGVPNYHELDPTPTMGIFFFLFFGIALGDFGYGLVLALGCLWFRRRMLLSEAGRLWFDLFALGGLSSMIFGVLTGSYFGIDINSLPAFLKRLIVIDPLNQAFIFLIITWVIGIIHILTGLILEFWDSWRNKDYATSVYENLSLIALMVSAVLALAGWMATAVLGSSGPFYDSLLSFGIKALGIAAVIYILLSGGFFADYIKTAARLARPAQREEDTDSPAGDIAAMAVLLTAVLALTVKSASAVLLPLALIVIIGALFVSPATRRALGNLGSGLYNLYGMSAFIGDILSYSRLMALGLATFLIGFVINTLAGLVVGFSVLGLPVGVLLAVLIAVPLHLVNLVINLLGAFVHPLRLQFVEFFSKFYEDGGRAFRPFALETEHLIFKGE